MSYHEKIHNKLLAMIISESRKVVGQGKELSIRGDLGFLTLYIL